MSGKGQKASGEQAEDAAALLRGEMEIKLTKEIFLGTMTGKGGHKAEDKLC